MAWFAKAKSKKEQIEEQRRRRRGDTVVLSVNWFNYNIVLGAVLFIALALAVTLICFAGLSPVTQQLVSNQRERERVVASFPFVYTSDVLTQRAKTLAGEMVGPSFKEPDHATEERMKQAVLELETALDQYQKDATGQTADQQAAAREKIARDFSAKNGFDLDPQDIASITANTTSPQRTQAFDEAVGTIHGILDRGIYNANDFGAQSTTPEGVLAQEDALREFHINLAPLDVDAPAKGAIYDLLKQALEPNIQFDKDRTERAKTAAMDTVKPTVVQVHEGQVLTDPSSPTYDTDEQNELLKSYFAQLRLHNGQVATASNLLAQRFLSTTLLLLAALIFIKCGLGQCEQSAKIVALASALLLVNLVLLRMIIGLGSVGLFAQRPEWLAVLPWLAPTMLAPLLTAVMIGTGPALLVALLVSTLFAMMTGDTLEVFLLNFLASLVAIYFCREVRARLRLVRAALIGGLVAAVCAIYLGFLNQSALTAADISRQIFAAIGTGVLTGVAAIGLLPVCENLFKITTDITLLELTDYNHPLLRRLQMTAPGTYHHSLMVANLSERAASEVGANPLLCRACCLFHDIGKTVKPEYFTENQRDGYDPHQEVSPSMSALIIKSHVSEGLDLARQIRLPRVVQDVIAQHHGTTLIKYFYHKASRQQRLFTNPPIPRGRGTTPPMRMGDTPPPLAPSRDEPAVDQSFYRYDGPKPNFKESAIISLADPVEAASRCLRKVTPQAVEELVESLINDRIEDHQLDDSPITIQELKKIRESFVFTVLNMLHSRVQYPEMEGGDGSGKGKETAASADEAKPAAPAPVARSATAAANVSTSSANA